MFTVTVCTTDGVYYPLCIGTTNAWAAEVMLLDRSDLAKRVSVANTLLMLEGMPD